MNPYQGRGTCDGKVKRKRKRRSANTTDEIKQEVVVKEESRTNVEMVDIPRPQQQSPSTEIIDAIKSDYDTDSKMYSEYFANHLKEEVKSEDECSKKDCDSANDAGSNGGDDLGDLPAGENVNNPGPSSNNKGKKKKRKVKGKESGDRKKQTNARASKKAAVNRQKKHACHSCGYATSHKPNLTRHIRVHTGKKPFVCKVCAKSFTQKSSLNLHEKIHKGIKPFECSICSKLFSQTSNLRFHLRTHIKQLPFACSMCGQRFEEGNQKQSHEERFIRRRFECYLCQYKSFVGGNLKSHMRLKHIGKKPFECAVCDMKFCHKSHLKQPLATHAKPRPIHCSKCWKRFTEEGKKDVHEGQCNRRLHQCYLCKFNANHSTCVKSHMQSKHTGERPFPCQYCEARFVGKINATRHMKRQHGFKNSI